MFLLRHTCSIYRRESTGTGITSRSELLSDNNRCLVVPMDSKSSAENGFDLGKGYMIYFPPTIDVKTGDKIDANMGSITKTFIVSGVKPFIDMPPVSHVECICSINEV